MARLNPLEVDQLTPEQKALFAKVSRGRSRVQGPFAVWIHNAPIAEAADKMIEAVRQNGKLGKPLYELLVLTVARHASVHYAWAVHEPLARAAGVDPAVIDALRERKKPSFAHADDGLIYAAATSLLQTARLPEATYQALLERFGLELTIEIVTVIGVYCMIGTVLNGFEIATPGGEKTFA